MRMTIDQTRTVLALLGELLETFEDITDADLLVNQLEATIDDLTVRIMTE